VSRPRILLAAENAARFGDALQDEFDVVRLWTLNSDAEVRTQACDVRAVVASGNMPIRRTVLEALPNLGLVACVGSGYEQIDMMYLRGRCVPVTHAPGLNSRDVAEFAVAGALAQVSNLIAYDRFVRDGGWERGERIPTRRALRTLHAGVLGLGSIGAVVAARMAALGMAVSWWGPHPKPEVPYPRQENLLALAKASDILFVTARADASNEKLIDAKTMDAVGPEGVIVNVSRGTILDEDALVSALNSGALGGAVIDTFWTEPAPAARWAATPNLLLSPHAASATRDSSQALFDHLRENLRRFFTGKPLMTLAPGSAPQRVDGPKIQGA